MAAILIVDNDAAFRKDLGKFLAALGHGVLEAAGGVDALEQVRNQRPNLVIAAVQMAGMDGFDFVKRLRGEPGIAQTSVILMTGVNKEVEIRSLAD